MDAEKLIFIELEEAIEFDKDNALPKGLYVNRGGKWFHMNFDGGWLSTSNFCICDKHIVTTKYMNSLIETKSLSLGRS